MYQLDIKNIFLRRDLQKEVYMDQLSRYVVSGSENVMCRLKKALYGLVTSSLV